MTHTPQGCNVTPKANELAELLKEEVIPEIEDYMDELFERIANEKHASSEDKEEYEELREMRDSFREMLVDVESGEMDDEECEELIEEIDAMRDIEEDEE